MHADACTVPGLTIACSRLATTSSTMSDEDPLLVALAKRKRDAMSQAARRKRYRIGHVNQSGTMADGGGDVSSAVGGAVGGATSSADMSSASSSSEDDDGLLAKWTAGTASVAADISSMTQEELFEHFAKQKQSITGLTGCALVDGISHNKSINEQFLKALDPPTLAPKPASKKPASKKPASKKPASKKPALPLRALSTRIAAAAVARSDEQPDDEESGRESGEELGEEPDDGEDPAAQPAAKPAAKPTVEPVVEPVVEPAAELAVEIDWTLSLDEKLVESISSGDYNSWQDVATILGFPRNKVKKRYVLQLTKLAKHHLQL
jgi:hypothetical protein